MGGMSYIFPHCRHLGGCRGLGLARDQAFQVFEWAYRKYVLVKTGRKLEAETSVEPKKRSVKQGSWSFLVGGFL